MKRLLNSILVLLTFCMFTAWAGQIGIVDMQQVFQQSTQVKKINDDLTKQFSSRRDEIVKLNKDFQANVQKFQKDKTVMSAKDLDDLKNKITTQEGQLRQEQSKFQQDLFAAQDAQMKKFMDTVKSVVQKIADDKKLDVVLPKNSVLYAGNGMDITSDVIGKLK